MYKYDTFITETTGYFATLPVNAFKQLRTTNMQVKGA